MYQAPFWEENGEQNRWRWFCGEITADGNAAVQTGWGEINRFRDRKKGRTFGVGEMGMAAAWGKQSKTGKPKGAGPH